MLKPFFIFLFFLGITYGQTNVDKILNESWQFSKKELFAQFKGKNLEEKETMGYSGYVMLDTLNSLIIDIGFFFNSDDIQKMRGVMNKNKSEKESKKLFELLFSSINKLLGKAIADNEMMGARMLQWKSKDHTIILNHSSDTCMLSILK